MKTEEVECPECGHKEIQEIPENMTRQQAFQRATQFTCTKCGWKPGQRVGLIGLVQQ